MDETAAGRIDIPYTIAFCVVQDTILMLHRKFPPNQHHWNGIGGSIDPGETPAQAMAREAMEEAQLDFDRALAVQYAGVVTWAAAPDTDNFNKGMYAYIVHFADPVGWTRKPSDEGLLEWKARDWVIDKSNRTVVDNIPHFLPPMLSTDAAPRRYHCHYVDGHFRSLSIHPLPAEG